MRNGYNMLFLLHQPKACHRAGTGKRKVISACVFSDQPTAFLSSPPPSSQRQCGRWLPALMVLTAMALAVFLAHKDSLMI